MKCPLLLLLPVLLTAGFLSSSPSVSADGAATIPSPIKTTHVHGRLVDTDGKPAVHAVLTVTQVQRGTEKAVSTQKINTSADGSYSFDVNLNPTDGTYPWIVASTDSAVAPISFFDLPTGPTVLEPYTKVRVRLVGSDRKPIGSIAVSPDHFLVTDGSSTNYVYWLNSVDNRWSAVTDSDGYATFANLPQSYGMALKVEDKRFVQPDATVQLATTSVTPDQTLYVTLAASISGTLIFSDTKLPAPNMQVSASGLNAERNPCRGYARTDAQGNFKMAELSPGSYSVTFDGPEPVFNQYIAPIWTAIAAAVNIKAGDDLTGVQLSLIHGALITGVVTNKFTGKPDKGIFAQSNGPDHPDIYATENATMTDSDGKYTLCVAPGDQTVFASTMYGGVIPRDDSARITISDGATKALDFAVPDPGTPGPVGGVVYGVDGKPAAFAEVFVLKPQNYPSKELTDAKGRFDFALPGLFPADRIYAMSGSLITALSFPVGTSEDLSLKLAANQICSITGNVKDIKGRPVPSATINLFQKNENGGGYEVDEAKSNSHGTYIFPGELAAGNYSLGAMCKGYDQTNMNSYFTGAAGKTVHAPTLVMNISDSFVGGEVVDRTGAAVSGAVVFDEMNRDNNVTTGVDGRFYLKGVPEKNVILEVQAPEGRQASIEKDSGTTTNIIKVMNQTEQEAESKKFTAILDADTTNHGDGTPAVVLLHKAEKAAAAGHKSVLITFHASWCGPCFMLHKFFTDPAVKQVLDKHFVVQAIDVWENGKTKPWENIGGADMYKTYGATSNGVPFTVILSADGKRQGDSRYMGQNMGMPNEKPEIDFFLGELKRAQPTLTVAELSVLRAGLIQTNMLFN